MSGRNQQRITGPIIGFIILALLAPEAAQAGTWMSPAGSLWTKVSWFRQAMDEWYTDNDQPILRPDNTLGSIPAVSRQPYLFNGNYESVAVFLEGYFALRTRSMWVRKCPGLTRLSTTTLGSIRRSPKPASATCGSSPAGS
jgi:hypothetical protein